MTTETIKQGESSDLRLISRPEIVDGALTGNNLTLGADDVCKIAVEGTAISRTITAKTADSTAYLAQLTPTETATLSPGVYTMAIEINNTTDAYNSEQHIALIIEQGVI